MTLHPDTITLRRPDDWYIHLRDDEILNTVLPYTSDVFARAIVLPILVPPVTFVAVSKAYRERILAVTPAAHRLPPLLPLFLT